MQYFFCCHLKELKDWVLYCTGVFVHSFFFSSLNLIPFPQVAAASLPSTVTVRRTTPGQIVGTWWRPCPPGGHGWAWPPSATDCTPWEGEWREPQCWLRRQLIWQLISYSRNTRCRGTQAWIQQGKEVILDNCEEKCLFYRSNAKNVFFTRRNLLIFFLMHINSGMTAPRTSQQLSPTTPSLTPGSRRFPWEQGAAVWA